LTGKGRNDSIGSTDTSYREENGIKTQNMVKIGEKEQAA
jgi:hypothetical protein